MKKILAVVLGLALLTIGLPVAVLAVPTLTIYDNDASGWQSAVINWETEDFADATLNPGVSVTTDMGYVTGGLWWDRLSLPDDGDWETTWHFAAPISAFGGYWDTGNPGGPGTGIAVFINGSWVYVGEISQYNTGQFWGFTSSEPFTDVLLDTGSAGGAWAETYELDNMVYSFEPMEVEIDIKPMSDPNSINLKSKGVIPVAILSTATFDATTVDGTTVTFAGAYPIHDITDPLVIADHQHDVDLDGDIDYVFHFAVQDTSITSGETSAMLTGNTLGIPVPIWGTDSILTRH